MKIVVTVHTYWPARNGVQYVTQYLCEGLSAKGHDVTVITTVSNPNIVCEEIHNNVKIIRAYLKTRYSFINKGVTSYRKLVLDNARDADVVINCCVQSPNNNVLLPILKDIPAFKMLYMHGMHSFDLKSDEKADLRYRAWHIFMNIRWSLFYHFNAKNFNQYDALVDIHETSPAINYLKSLGVAADGYIINNAVEDFDIVEVTEQDKQKYPILGGRFLLNVSNFTPRKNQLTLVDSFWAVKKRNNVKLVLIGGASDYCDDLKKKINEIGMDEEVLIYENQEREITRKFIKNCLCGVMSSRFEVYPIFLCEVINCGHPYISTDVGCVRDIPGGEIVSSAEELTKMMERMINDDTHRKELGSVGKEFAQAYLSQSSKIDQLESILQRGIRRAWDDK